VLTALPSTQGLYGFAGYFMFQSHFLRSDSSYDWYSSCCRVGARHMLWDLKLYSPLSIKGMLVLMMLLPLLHAHNVFDNTLILADIPEMYAMVAVAATC